ncbi:glycoside hydrolase family 25 protein [Paenibacillus sp. CC-CFT747]|nr:glycoside hydrolase family 25 protein [Paenibacillus sp. CC-CFT747]
MQNRTEEMARGIDVSHHQGRIDWPKVQSSGISFAFMKATEGSTFKDPRFVRNAAEAAETGIAIGAYHFMRAKSPEEAAREAEHFVRTLEEAGSERFTLPPVLDVETNDGGLKPAQLSLLCRTWLERVQDALGKTPLLYTYLHFARTALDDTLSDFPLWFAYYNESCPPDCGGWTRWSFWQHSDKGTVPGISGPVDLNFYEGTVADLTGYKLKEEDANKIIQLLQASWNMIQDYPEARDEIHRLADELRLASGQPVA